MSAEDENFRVQTIKVLFLDIDGVLNNEESCNSPEALKRAKDDVGFMMTERCFHPDCVANIREILDRTGAVMVMSSAWKSFFSESNVALIRAGLPPCIDKAGWTKGATNRGECIDAWLKKHEQWMEIESFVIIDDSRDMLENQMANFVNTKSKIGITKEEAEKAIEILGE